MKNNMYLKKLIMCITTIICLSICNLESVLATEKMYLYTTETHAANNITESYIPEQVEQYFNQIHDSAISVGKICGLIDENIKDENLIAGNPFKILELNGEDKNIWYFPIYNDSEIILIVTVGLVNNALEFSLTQEFVEQLNQISYEDNMIIFKENDVIYIIDKENNIYSLSYGELTKCDINKKYSDVLESLMLNYSISVLPDNVAKSYRKNISKINAKGGIITDIDGGRECVMTNCFVKQYNYGICWAASVATILRYLKPEYSTLNAFDVAYTLAYYEDISTDDPNDKNSIWRRGATNDEAQLILAIYGIYGYYSKERTQYFKMWNPGNGTTQTIRYNISGDAIYFYNNNYFQWNSTVCNGTYIQRFK